MHSKNPENRVSQANQLRAAILAELLATAQALATIDDRQCPTCGERYGRLHHRACAGCLRHFSSSSPARRYHSNACKQAAFRRRHQVRGSSPGTRRRYPTNADRQRAYRQRRAARTKVPD